MLIGYARVSTKDQNLDLQMDALNQKGCEVIFTEKFTGTTKQRPQLEKLLQSLRKGDVVVIWKLDRLGRSLKDLLHIVGQLQDKGVELVSLQDNIDTTSATGKLIFHIFGALAEFERELISERTKAGLASARARGRKGGRPKGLSKGSQKTAMAAETLYKEGVLSVSQICKELGISKPTLYNYLRHRGVAIGVIRK